MKRALLLGGGYTLQHLAALLPTAQFVITSRSAERCAEFATRGWEARRVDVMEQRTLEALREEFESFSVIVDSVPPDRAEPAKGPHNVVQTLGAAAERIVYLSTTGVYGVENGSEVSDDTPPAPLHPHAKARRISEMVYDDHHSHVTLLRLPAIYGPGRGIGHALERGTLRVVEGERWSNRIHVVDLARLIAALIAMPRFAPGVIAVADEAPTPFREVIDFYCAHCRFPPPQTISRAEAEARGLHTMLSHQRVVPRRMRELLPVLQYPSFREGAASEFS